MNAPTPVTATPAQVGSSITRAWIAYFLVVTVIGMVLSFVIGGIFNYVASSMMGMGPMSMRIGIWTLSLLINAPISFLVFTWAVRRKVLPAVLEWNAGGPAP